MALTSHRTLRISTPHHFCIISVWTWVCARTKRKEITGLEIKKIVRSPFGD